MMTDRAGIDAQQCWFPRSCSQRNIPLLCLDYGTILLLEGNMTKVRNLLLHEFIVLARVGILANCAKMVMRRRH
jgi:hypothetical protein